MPAADQLNLFGEPPLAERRGPPLPSVAASPELVSLAARLPPRIRFGTVSWSYPGWNGILFAGTPSEQAIARRGLTAYAQHPLLTTVEIGRTYYRPIAAEVYAEYAAQVPESFRFVAKAHDECITVRFPNHPRYGEKRGQRNLRLLDVAYATDAVVAPFVTGLGDKAGILLFQFPPQEIRSPAMFADKLHRFLSQLPKLAKGAHYAVEVRNRELLTPAYGEALAAGGAVHCHNAWEMMPNVLDQAAMFPAATRLPLVIRWMLRPGDTHEEARSRFMPFDKLLEEDLIIRQHLVQLSTAPEVQDAPTYLLMANKAEGCAPESIFRLARAVDAAVNAPSPLSGDASVPEP